MHLDLNPKLVWKSLFPISLSIFLILDLQTANLKPCHNLIEIFIMHFYLGKVTKNFFDILYYLRSHG